MIDYLPTGRSDLLTIRTLRDLQSVSEGLVLVGAWMTRIWVLARRRPEAIRRTNDVDVGLTPEVPSGSLVPSLRSLGYEQDSAGYPFRYQRMSQEGLLIVDLLVDSRRASAEPDALAVYGLDTALTRTVAFDLRIAGLEQSLTVRVPTLARAVLLRALALEQARAGLKFEDYANDFATLVLAVDEEATGELNELRSTAEFAVASRIVMPLFASLDAPGSRAYASVAHGDPDVAARNLAAAVRSVFAR